MWRAFWTWVNRAASIVQLWQVLSGAALLAMLSGILTYLSRMPWWGILITEAVVFGGIVAGGVWMVRRAKPVSPVGMVSVDRRPKRFWKRVRDMQREVHDPYGHELRRLVELLAAEIAGNLRYQSAAPERRYLTAVLDHMRAHRAEHRHPELAEPVSSVFGGPGLPGSIRAGVLFRLPATIVRPRRSWR